MGQTSRTGRVVDKINKVNDDDYNYDDSDAKQDSTRAGMSLDTDSGLHNVRPGLL